MKFTIFKRLTFAYMAIMILVVFLGVYVSLKLNQLNRLTRAVAAVDETTIRPIEHLMETVYSQVSFEKKYIISKDPDFYDRFLELDARIARELDRLGRSLDGAGPTPRVQEVEQLHSRYLDLFMQEAGWLRDEKAYNQEDYRRRKEDLVEALNQRLGELIRSARERRADQIRASYQISDQVLKVTSVSAAAVIVIGLLISFFNTRGINRSILLLQEKTKEIAAGRFEEIGGIHSPPEIKELADDFNTMCERLRELDEMKADFISHVSHELRTPLTAIKEASSMLLEGTYKKAPEKEQELLKITKDECERLIQSVNRILDLSRMEGNMMDYQFAACPLMPVLRRTILKLAPIALREGIHLRFKPRKNLPLVTIDEERIGQVLQDLLGNALKFTERGGRVVIHAALQENSPETIVVSVADTGCGIPEEAQEKIFDRFKRIETGRHTVRGTGLGLSIAKYIISAHGGRIWAKSEPGKGSTFYFTLPVSSD